MKSEYTYQFSSCKRLVIPFEEKQKNSAVEVEIEKIPKKTRGGGTIHLSYVPWLEARILLDRYYPNLVVDYKVGTDLSEEYYYILLRLVEIAEEINKASSELFYPVMDYGHNNLKKPGTTDINTAIMRGSAKLVAIETGLGLSVYRRNQEDLLDYKEDKAQKTTNTTTVTNESKGFKLI